MPYTCEKELIPPHLKRSSKLTSDDKAEMRRMYKLGGWSYSKLGSEFGVSKKTAYFAVNPDKEKENYQKRVERGGSKIYYECKKHTQSMREYRRYKKELADNGKLIKRRNNEN